MKTVKSGKDVITEYRFGDKIVGKDFDDITYTKKEVSDWVSRMVAGGTDKDEAKQYAQEYEDALKGKIK